MDEEVAHFEDGIIDVVAEHGLAEMFDEDAPDGRAVVEDAAVMAGAGPELVALFGVVDEGAEERGFEGFGVLAEFADQVLGDEFGGFFGEEDVAGHTAEHFDGDFFQLVFAHQHEDRHVHAAVAHQRDQRGHLALPAALAPVDEHAAHGAVRADGEFRVVHVAGFLDFEAEFLDFLDDFLDADSLQVLGVEAGGADEKVESPFVFHAWPLAGAAFLAAAGGFV